MACRKNLNREAEPQSNIIGGLNLTNIKQSLTSNKYYS